MNYEKVWLLGCAILNLKYEKLKIANFFFQKSNARTAEAQLEGKIKIIQGPL